MYYLKCKSSRIRSKQDLARWWPCAEQISASRSLRLQQWSWTLNPQAFNSTLMRTVSKKRAKISDFPDTAYLRLFTAHKEGHMFYNFLHRKIHQKLCSKYQVRSCWLAPDRPIGIQITVGIVKISNRIFEALENLRISMECKMSSAF